MENLEAIASTPGVDILWVGHFDLTQSMGIPGHFGDQRFIDALNKVVEIARKHGLGAGIQPGSPDQTKQWMAMGYNVISYSADFALYLGALSEGVRTVRGLAAPGAS